MMSKLIHIFKHRYKLTLLQKRTLLSIIIILCTTITYMNVVKNQNSNSTTIPIVIVDNDKSEYSITVIDRLKRKPSISVKKVESIKEAFQLVKESKVEAAYIFKESFMEDLLAGEHEEIVHLYHSPTSISIGIINEIIASEINRLSTNVKSAMYVTKKFQQYHIKKGDDVWNEAWLYTDNQWEPVPLLTMDYFELGSYTTGELLNIEAEKNKRSISYLLGILASIFMLYIFIYNQWLVNEKKQGVISRVSFTGISKRAYIMTNNLAILSIALFLFIPMLIYLSLLFDLTFQLFIQLFLTTVLFLTGCSMISLFFSTIISSERFYQLVMFAIVICTTLFGGIFFKLSDITDRFASYASFTPQHWYITVIRSTLEKQNIEVLSYPLSILFSITIVFYLFSHLLLEVNND